MFKDQFPRLECFGIGLDTEKGSQLQDEFLQIQLIKK